VSKELAAFPRLLSTSAEDVVDFYDRFHEMGVAYLLPTTPLDAIVLHLGYEGLFPPALGTMRYSACGKGMLELLQHLAPPTLYPAFNAILSTVRSEETANGYDLLWRILRQYVPGFDKAKPIVFPFWTRILIYLSSQSSPRCTSAFNNYTRHPSATTTKALPS
jgi:hypothetical protein